MTLDALLAELKLKKLRVTLNGNGPTPVLNIEPKDQVTPELLDALRQHKDALIGLLNRTGRPSVFDQVRACLAGLPEVITVEVLAGPLRSIASLMADEDALTRALIRADTIAALEVRKVRGPATIVDAAIAGLPMKGEEETAGRRLLLADIEVWPEPVDGIALLDEIVATITKYVILPAGAAETIALWIVHCHAVAAFDLSPYLAITSPERRCGKTTTLALIARLVPRPVPSANITAAALFRAVEKYNPVLLIDEADLFIEQSPELRGILNSGHTRSSAFVVRTVGEDLEAKMFSTFCPKAIALIKNLPATIEDRSIVLALSRKKRGEAVERVRLDRLAGLLDPLCRRAARWAADHLAALREADPDVPAEISNDRTVDNWRPLLAIADHAGGVWPATAREAALAVSGIEPEDTGTGVVLLADLRALFLQKGTAALWTKTILEHLVSLDERPWPAYDHGRPITARQLGELLKPFKVESRNIRIDEVVFKGYKLADLAEPFERYLSGQGAKTGSQSATSATPAESLTETPVSDPLHDPSVADEKQDLSVGNDRDVTHVADGNPENEGLDKNPGDGDLFASPTEPAMGDADEQSDMFDPPASPTGCSPLAEPAPAGAHAVVYAFDTETVDGEPITLQWAGPDGASLFRVNRETILVTLAGLLRDHGSPQGTNLLWAHNLGFDLGVSLIEHPEIWRARARGRPRVVTHGMIVEVSIYKGRLLSASIVTTGRQWLLLDTMSFFDISLEAAGDRLRLPVKKLPRPAYLGQRLPTEDEWPAFEAYATTDALAAYHLGRFIIEAHREFALPTTISIAKMAGVVFTARYLRGAAIPSGAQDTGFLTASRESYHGGKNGLFVKPGIYENVAEVDIVSAYPHAMVNLPPLTHGCWERMREHVPGTAAIFRVRGTVRTRCPYGVFLVDPKGTKVHDGDFDCWITGYELESAANEISTEIIDGYVWRPDSGGTNPFRAYVEEFFRRKQDTPKDDPLREMYKLLLNSLYGKLNQEGGALYAPFWASQITGHCRARLHELEHRFAALHSSTDSILTSATDIMTGSALGDLEIKARGRLLLGRNKLYVLLGPDGRVMKSTLHGFQGSAETLLNLLRRGENTYRISHMIRPREALVGGKKPFTWIEREMHLNLPKKDRVALASALMNAPGATGLIQSGSW